MATISSTDFEEALKNVEEVSNAQKSHLNKILEENAAIFRAEPGRIHRYQHRLQVTDSTTFFQKGWPIPIAYQEKVEDEIRQML